MSDNPLDIVLAGPGTDPRADYRTAASRMWFNLYGEAIGIDEAESLLGLPPIDKSVVQSRITYTVGDVIDYAVVSTIFLVVNYGLPFGNRLPVLWETYVLSGPTAGFMDRYVTVPAALDGHHAALVDAMRAMHAAGYAIVEVEQEIGPAALDYEAIPAPEIGDLGGDS